MTLYELVFDLAGVSVGSFLGSHALRAIADQRVRRRRLVYAIRRLRDAARSSDAHAVTAAYRAPPGDETDHAKKLREAAWEVVEGAEGVIDV